MQGVDLLLKWVEDHETLLTLPCFRRLRTLFWTSLTEIDILPTGRHMTKKATHVQLLMKRVAFDARLMNANSVWRSQRAVCAPLFPCSIDLVRSGLVGLDLAEGRH